MGKRPQRVTTLTYSPRNWWALAQLLQVLLHVDQLLSTVAVEEIGTSSLMGFGGTRLETRSRWDVKVMPKPVRLDLGTLKTWAADLEALNIRLKKFHKRIGARVP